jgi:hypothetical protein
MGDTAVLSGESNPVMEKYTTSIFRVKLLQKLQSCMVCAVTTLNSAPYRRGVDLLATLPLNT